MYIHVVTVKSETYDDGKMVRERSMQVFEKANTQNDEWWKSSVEKFIRDKYQNLQ